MKKEIQNLNYEELSDRLSRSQTYIRRIMRKLMQTPIGWTCFILWIVVLRAIIIRAKFRKEIDRRCELVDIDWIYMKLDLRPTLPARSYRFPDFFDRVKRVNVAGNFGDMLGIVDKATINVRFDGEKGYRTIPAFEDIRYYDENGKVVADYVDVNHI